MSTVALPVERNEYFSLDKKLYWVRETMAENDLVLVEDCKTLKTRWIKAETLRDTELKKVQCVTI
jgi:hypothetical protein